MTRILSDREVGEIIKLRGLGYSQDEIAQRMNVSPSTISYQLQRVNQMARDKGDDKAFAAFLFGAGVGLLVAALLSDDEK